MSRRTSGRCCSLSTNTNIEVKTAKVEDVEELPEVDESTVDSLSEEVLISRARKQETSR